MKDLNGRCPSHVVSMALAAGLGLFAMASPAAAASLEADFNGDGFNDLAVGVPEEEFGSGSGRGAVNVFYGSATGLTGQGDQLWHQDAAGIRGVSGSFENFGAALASGDFNGDGFADLAVGVPNDHVGGLSWVGSVNVIYGSAAGLTDAGNQLWHEDKPGVLGVGETFDFFGKALAAGDFDGDGKDDLAIGVPFESFGTKDFGGQVHVLYGTRRGLTADGDQIWHQNKNGVRGRAKSNDLFGSSLAAGDFDNDGKDDLAIGVPLDYVKGDFNLPAGAVNVLYGSGGGLTVTGNQIWHQEVPGIAGATSLGEQFGHALAVGDFNNDGRDDLAVGVPLDVVGPVGNAGAVNVIYGTSGGLNASGNQLWHQNKKGVNEAAEVGDAFGFALAAGDFDGNGRDDLAIGVPQETIGTIGAAGAVNVIYGTSGGLSASGDQLWHQNKKGVANGAQLNDAFGHAVSAGDFDGDGKDDLVIGVPGEDIGTLVNAGIVNLLRGASGGLSAAGDQVWHQDRPGVRDLAEDGDTFGLALP